MADICREHYNICRFYKLTIQNKYDKEDLLFFRYVVIVICFYNECKYWKTTNKISYSHQIVIDLSAKLKVTEIWQPLKYLTVVTLFQTDVSLLNGITSLFPKAKQKPMPIQFKMKDGINNTIVVT